MPVDGESDSVFCFGPPGDALLMTLTPPVGGMPLAVPNSKTSAAWESGIGCAGSVGRTETVAAQIVQHADARVRVCIGDGHGLRREAVQCEG